MSASERRPIRSAGTCAAPVGIDTVNVVPLSTSLATATRAAMHRDQFADEGEPDARSLVRPGARALATIEPVEHVRQILGCDAHASVADRQRRRARPATPATR